ncbi:ATP-binding protein [Lentzea sp. NPDC042327]|uniref:ATP-binding protein n=1 Tax=Lentzea sp. NPDC042327 TaxID=3154801 RepID=UPI00340F01F4
MSTTEDVLPDRSGTRRTLAIEDDVSELRRARDWVREQLTGLTADQAEDVVLAADELVSNALRHGAAPRTLTLLLRPGSLRFEVEDGEPAPARPREGTTTGGRGLTLVDALATDWGQQPTGRGKVVWAEFTLD